MQIKKNEIILNEEDFKNKLRELEEKYSSFLDPFVYNREENFRQNLKRYFERCKKLFYKDIRQKNNKLYIIEYKSLCDKYYH
jgi:membrane-bound lytic murein transglycosylase MltF